MRRYGTKIIQSIIKNSFIIIENYDYCHSMTTGSDIGR